MPKVYNLYHRNAPADAVYCGRGKGLQWGNPFVIGKDGDRDTVCDKFDAYAVGRVSQEPNWLEPLRGKDLVCFCAASRCHCDTLLRLANQEVV